MRAAPTVLAALALLGLLELSSACGASKPPAQTGPVEISEDLAPVPFPPGSLAESLRAGATMTFRMEEAGEEPYLRTTEFVRVGDEGTTMRVSETDLDGQPRGEPQTAEASWEELESHAHFPRRATTISNATVEVPAGRFEAYLYEVELEKQGVPMRSRFWFARSLPGPPVKMVQEVGGEEAVTMTLVETERP